MKAKAAKRIAALAALVCFALVSAVGTAGSEALIGQRITGIRAPYMAEGGLPSDEYFTEADFAQNAITVVNFWDSGCMNCRIEMPYFQQAYEAYSPRGVGFLGVTTRWIGGSFEMAWQLLGDMGITYPVVIVDEGFTALMEADHGVPYTLIVSSEGVILDAHRGRLEYEELEDMILAALCPPGDIDCNGQVTMADVSLLAMHLNGEAPTISSRGMVNADANLDGAVDIRDIAAIYAVTSLS